MIRCLYKADFLEEALLQAEAALHVTNGKPLFIFYKAAVLFAMGKTKEALLQLDSAMVNTPKLLKNLLS